MATPMLTTNEETAQAKAGLRLLQVIPVAFPDHLLIRHLKNELRLAQEAALIRGWNDNNPARLRQELIVFNRVTHECCCDVCKLVTRFVGFQARPAECRIWGRVTHYMAQAGVSMVYGMDEQRECYFLMRAASRAVDVCPVCMEPEERPAGFDEMTACPFMAPVSHLNAHVVFRRRGNPYEFVFGRRLWDQREFDNAEMRKLDLFRARLRAAWSGF
jgi:hypothetical protein